MYYEPEELDDIGFPSRFYGSEKWSKQHLVDSINIANNQRQQIIENNAVNIINLPSAENLEFLTITPLNNTLVTDSSFRIGQMVQIAVSFTIKHSNPPDILPVMSFSVSFVKDVYVPCIRAYDGEIILGFIDSRTNQLSLRRKVNFDDEIRLIATIPV